MKKSVKLFLIAIYAIGMFGITGCVDEHQERYETPPWLGGSSIETLEEKGNYTIFLDLMEKANYTEPISKQLFTLFVPSDESFREYFQTTGINSVDDMTKDEAVQLFTQHVLRNPRSRIQLVYEYAWGEFQGPWNKPGSDGIFMGEYASLFHRKPTPSTAIPYNETVKYSPASMVGEQLLVYTREKNVPLWSEEWMGDYGAAPDGSDYLAMYPGSTWREGYVDGLGGMNWHDAMVVPNPEIPEELEVRTANGFIYYLDRVVAPMPSIEEYMKANLDKYGLYYDMMQRFADYGGQTVDDQKRVLYRKSYDLLFNLAEERASSMAMAVPPQNMWTAFLPNNQTLQKYLDETVLKYYPTLDEVPRVTMYYILQTQLSRAVVLHSKLSGGTYYNAFGDETDYGPEDIASGFMCSNGVIYESKKVMEPNVFTCVPGLLFIDQNYSTLLFILSEANMLTSLANPDSYVTLFASTNEALEEYGIRYNETDAAIEFRSPANDKWSKMNAIELVEFAQDQIFMGTISDVSGDEKFVEVTSGNFIKYGDNKVEGPENQFYGNSAGVSEVVENERNGFVIKVDKPVESRLVIGQYLVEDKEISDFVRLLTSSRLLNKRFRDPVTKEIIPQLKFYAADQYWTALIPTNAAMEEAVAAGIIPDGWPSDSDEQDKVEDFIMYHFMKGNVVFNDGERSGNFDSNLTYLDDDGKTRHYHKVKADNTSGNLILEDILGNQISVDRDKSNILVRKGVVHKINSVLKHYE